MCLRRSEVLRGLKHYVWSEGKWPKYRTTMSCDRWEVGLQHYFLLQCLKYFLHCSFPVCVPCSDQNRAGKSNMCQRKISIFNITFNIAFKQTIKFLNWKKSTGVGGFGEWGSSQVACVSEDLKCWGAWSITSGVKGWAQSAQVAYV